MSPGATPTNPADGNWACDSWTAGRWPRKSYSGLSRLAVSFNLPPEGTSTTIRNDLGQILGLLRSGPAGAAQIWLKKILNQNPTDGQAAFMYGLSLHQAKRYSEARGHFDQALEHASEYATTHHFLGWCLFYEGELELTTATTLPQEGQGCTIHFPDNWRGRRV